MLSSPVQANLVASGILSGARSVSEALSTAAERPIRWTVERRFPLSALRLTTVGALVVILGSCGRLDATREFNYGINDYNDGRYGAAVHSFERASQALQDPAIYYDLALAHLALVRESADGGDSKVPRPEQVAAGLAAVATARELPDLTDEMLAKLGYIEGSLYTLARDEQAARDAFSESLRFEPDFKPTLKALLKLDPESSTAVGRLLLATADVDDLKPEDKLSQ